MPKDAVMRKLLGATTKLDRLSRSDRDLLRQFVDGHDESAFEALVKRHTNLVLGVCRRSLANAQDAEDACQAVFLILAKKANSERWQSSIANWLYSIARKVSRNARLAAERRLKGEGQAGRTSTQKSVSPLDKMTGRELLAIVDDELERLPAIYREPLVLCHLEGLSRNEVATRLGVGPGTIKIRLERGRKKLGDALTKRGIDVGGGLIAIAATSTAEACSPQLFESILATVGGSPSASVAATAKGVAMNGFALKVKLLAFAAVAVAVTGFGLASMQIEAGAQRPAVATSKQPATTDDTKGAKPRAEEPPAKSAAALRIAGRVLDADSGRPIAMCRVIPADDMEDRDRITWQSQYMKEFSDGHFLYETDRPWNKTLLRIEADGYRPAITRAVDKSEKSVEFDVKLVRDSFAGVVLSPNGQPAANAQVAIASHTNEVTVQKGKLSYSGHGDKLRKVVETDMQGRFTLPAEIDPSVMVVAHESGYAEITAIAPHSAKKTADVKQPDEAMAQNNQALMITVQPWGRVEGRVLAQNKPVAGAKFWVYKMRGDYAEVWAKQDVESNADGCFVVERFPSGSGGMCQRYADNSDGKGSHSISGLLVTFDVPPGKTTTLQLGSPGRALIGKLTLPEGFPHKLDWSKVNVSVHLQFPRNWQDKESLQSWSKFQQTQEGKLYARTNVKPAADGSFRLEDLPAAEYDLEVVVDGQAVIADKKPAGEIGRGSERFSVPAVAPPNASTPIDLGTINIKPAEKPRIKFEFHRAETKPAEGLTESTVAGTNEKVYVYKFADITNQDIAEARIVKDDGPVSPAIKIIFTKEGAKKMAKLSEQHINKPLAIVVDGKVISAPIVKVRFSDQVLITGNFTKEQVDELVNGINGK